MRASAHRSFTQLNVSVPEFFEAFNNVIANQPLDNIKDHVTWMLVNENSPMLNAAIREEHFNFFEKTLRGTKEMRARW